MTIDEYKRSKEAPEIPSSDPTQTDGEMLINTYTGTHGRIAADGHQPDAELPTYKATLSLGFRVSGLGFRV